MTSARLALLIGAGALAIGVAMAATWAAMDHPDVAPAAMPVQGGAAGGVQAGERGAATAPGADAPADAAAPDAAIPDPDATSARLPATQVLPALLTQIYRAFALNDEAAIYDALALAVSGDVVTDLYLQRRRAQVADHAEDGQTQITSVEVYDITPLPGTPDGYHVAWRVVGRVRHVSHIHERINLYAADLTLAPVDDVWKLSGFTLTDSSRETDYNFEGGE